uniref:Uncharacterized protein n=1 Tax=Mimiviridae sp. ChoanoV1 TaxID=2596887 RepID=A0A5B8HW78_9VIRU|nr:hypothetical protein 2_25 [Mimiviridae sp. ChoanoV1]
MFHKFDFIQHNLSAVEYFDSSSSTKSLKVASSNDTYRNIQSYLNKNRLADLYTLQNVETKTNSKNGEIQIEKNKNRFKYEYNDIGSEKYYIKNTSNTIYRKNGCAVVYDSNRFTFMDSFDLGDFPVLCDFASPLVQLQDNKSKEILLVLSVDSISPGPITLPRSNKIRKLFDSLIKMLETFDRICTKLDYNFSFIIGGDFKMNFFEPNLDDYNSSSVRKEEAKKIIDDSIKRLFTTFENLDIEYDLDDSIDTVYTGDDLNNYHNCNDFIFKSKYLITDETQYGCNHQGSLPIWEDLSELKDDFQHKSINCYLGLDKNYI